MSKARILFRNWIAEMGVDPSQVGVRDGQSPHDMDDGLQQEIIDRVNSALKRLTENEQELVRQYYFQGRSLSEVADLTGRRPYRLEAILARAIRKLRLMLAPYVAERFGIDTTQDYDTKGSGNGSCRCPICRTELRGEIEQVIAERDARETWGPVIRVIRDRFRVRIVSPQQIIGHTKYHAPAKERKSLKNK